MNFKKIFNESANSADGLRFKISSCLTYDKSDSGREQWRIDEDIAFDKALGIGLDKTFSFSELQSVINGLPEKMENYFKENNKNKSIIKTECTFNKIKDYYWHPACIVQFDRTDIYNFGDKCGDYIELFILFDYKSLEQTLNN